MHIPFGVTRSTFTWVLDFLVLQCYYPFPYVRNKYGSLIRVARTNANFIRFLNNRVWKLIEDEIPAMPVATMTNEELGTTSYNLAAKDMVKEKEM